MNYRTTLYEIPKDAGPKDEPMFVETFQVRADSMDAARIEVKRKLVEKGRTVRAMSMLVDGGISVIAYPTEMVSDVVAKKRGNDGEARKVGDDRKGRERKRGR